MERLFKILFVLILLLGYFGLADADVTITPASPHVGNCYPFGGTDNSPGWTPYAGFVYQNVPAFNISPGEIIAFDLGAQNDVPVQLDIAMASTTVNGGTVQSGSFVQVVSNTQTPANSTGDNIIGNFELRFVAEAPFSFPGGGLIIRFSNPSASYAADTTCDQVLVGANNADPSGYFVQRIVNDANGVSPWDNEDIMPIGGFRITTQNVSVPTMTEWGMIIFMALAGLGSIYYLRRQREA